MKRLASLLLMLVVIAPWQVVEAAPPLSLTLHQVEIFRHVIQTNDWLVLAHLDLIPTSQTGWSDTDSISTTDGDFDDPVTLINKVHITGGTDYTVTADTTDITDYCTLNINGVTINCVNTGLANATYTVTVTYRSGWDAYLPENVVVRLLKGSTIVEEDVANGVGYRLTAIYLSAAAVTAAGLSWGGATVGFQAAASPVLWDDASSMTVTNITWWATADLAATQTTLATRLIAMLQLLEQEDPDVETGDYVAPQGITDAGSTIAHNAFSVFGEVIPDAFLTSSTGAFAAPTPRNTSWITTIDTAASATEMTTLFSNISPWFGRVLFLGFAAVAFGVAQAKMGAFGVSMLAFWVVLLLG